MDVWKVTARQVKSGTNACEPSAPPPGLSVWATHEWIVNAEDPADAVSQAAQEAQAAKTALAMTQAQEALHAATVAAVGAGMTRDEIADHLNFSLDELCGS
jgi:hypothetical protein